MTLLKKKQELIAELKAKVAYGSDSPASCIDAFADALLEEACKAVCQWCAVGTPFSHEPYAHNVGTEDEPDYRYCKASAIRLGKGK